MLHKLNSEKTGVDQFSGKKIGQKRASTVMSDIKPKLESFGYIFIADITSVSVNLTQMAPIATALGKMTQNNGDYALQGHSRSPILVLVDRHSHSKCRASPRCTANTRSNAAEYDLRRSQQRLSIT